MRYNFNLSYMLCKKTICKVIAISNVGLCAVVLFFNTGCVESQKIAMKTGTQLWVENCQRCHNTPSPTSFSSSQWETIGMHMQSRALLTENEKNKIIAFLQTANG